MPLNPERTLALPLLERVDASSFDTAKPIPQPDLMDEFEVVRVEPEPATFNSIIPSHRWNHVAQNQIRLERSVRAIRLKTWRQYGRGNVFEIIPSAEDGLRYGVGSDINAIGFAVRRRKAANGSNPT
jgi:hypothetical protein